MGETAITELDSPLCHLKEDPPSAVKMADSPKQIVPSLFAIPDLSVTEMKASNAAMTRIFPVAAALPQPPVKGIL